MKFNIQNQTPSIDKMQNIMNEYDVIHQEFLKQKEITLQKFKESFNEVVKDFFELVPSVKKVVWIQYTPYFNDGDSCTFGVYSPTFCNFIDEDDEFTSYYDTSELEQGQWACESYSFKNKKSKLLSKDEVELVNFLSSLIESNEEFMLDIFGDHQVIVLTTDGIKQEWFEHD